MKIKTIPVFCKECGHRIRKKNTDLCSLCKIKLERKNRVHEICSSHISPNCEHELSFRNKSHICPICKKYLTHVKKCNCCNQDSYFTSSIQVACDNCLITNKFQTQFLSQKDELSKDFDNKLVFYTDLINYLLFISNKQVKFKNKLDEAKWKNNPEHLSKLKKLIDTLKTNIINIPNWTKIDNSYALGFLNGAAISQDGYNIFINNKIDHVYEFSFNEIPGLINSTRVKGLEWNRTQDFINMLLNFKFGSKDGPGEALLSLILSTRNLFKSSNADLSTIYNELIEVKLGNNCKTNTGRFLFSRSNYYEWKESDLNYIKNILNDILVKYISDKTVIEKFKNEYLNKATIYKCTFDNNGIYQNLVDLIHIYSVQNVSKAIIEIISKLIFNHKNNYNDFRFKNEIVDTHEKENVFHLINMLKYYIDYDAKHENLSVIAIISNKKVILIPVDFIRNCSLNDAINKFKNLVVAFPESNLTKLNGIVNDRNKCFTYGAFLK